jgi:hypothetical protein
MWCCWPAQIAPQPGAYEVVVSFVVEMTAWAVSFIFIPTPCELYLVSSTGSGGCGQRYIRYGVPMWCCWPAQIAPQPGAYEVVVSFVVEMTAWAGSFIFIPTPYELYWVSSTGSGWCGQRYIRYGGSMWCCWPAQTIPHLGAYEVVVSFVGEMTTWAVSFIFTSIPYKCYLVARSEWGGCGRC